MQSTDRKHEIDVNYDFLQRTLALLLPQHEGQYALLRKASIVAFYDRPGDAYRDGLAQFPDTLFSIQEITSEPLDLGFFSYAGA